MPRYVGNLTSLAITWMLCGGAGCSDDEPSAQDTVATTASPSADFTSYHTFALAQSKDPDAIPDNVQTDLALVDDAMVAQLERRGLQQVGSDDDPDLVAFNLATTDTEGTYYWDCVEGYWWGYWDQAWDPCAWLQPAYVEYTAGTIALGVADPALRQVVFGGVIRGVLDYTDDVEDRINDDVARVFDSYPTTQTGD